MANLNGSLRCVVSSNGDFDLITFVVESKTKDAETKRWRIDRPYVARRLQPYRMIQFSPGDTITVEASGCVQTGGGGLTWKRYVDPSGENIEKYYHGLIWIPGVPGQPVGSTPVRISTVIGETLRVDPKIDPSTGGLYLRLGYEDDNYDDKGYYDHDDGTEDQCKGVADAHVALNITHSVRPISLPPTLTPLSMDLEWKNTDANWLPLNPTWFWADTHKNQPPDPIYLCSRDVLSPQCTRQSPTVDEWNGPAYCGSDYNINGHANWMTATYEGSIQFEDHDPPSPFGDNDYNWQLTPSVKNAGLTSQNGTSLKLEFDSDETIDNFQDAWWQEFHDTVDNNLEAAMQMVENRRAIVSGLVGLDMVHHSDSVPAEIHPVYAMAVETSTSAVRKTTCWILQRARIPCDCRGRKEHSMFVF